MSVYSGVAGAVRAALEDSGYAAPALYRDEAPSTQSDLPYVVVRCDETSDDLAWWIVDASATVTVYASSDWWVDRYCRVIRQALSAEFVDDPTGEVSALRTWFESRTPRILPDAQRKAASQVFACTGFMADEVPGWTPPPETAPAQAY